MHRTLKAQTTRPAASNADEQQARFDAFRRHYNEERPHEALGQRPPAELYTSAPKAMPDRLGDPWYDADHQARRVRSAGEIKWKGSIVFVSQALIGELVGIIELETGDHVVRFCDLDVGLINRCGVFRRFAPPRAGLREAAEHAAAPKPSGGRPVLNVANQPRFPKGPHHRALAPWPPCPPPGRPAPRPPGAGPPPHRGPFGRQPP